MFAVIDLQPILEDQFCILGSSAQFRMVSMSVEARAALARRCRQFSNSLILFTISGADGVEEPKLRELGRKVP
jgi:hypothetical protein